MNVKISVSIEPWQRDLLRVCQETYGLSKSSIIQGFISLIAHKTTQIKYSDYDKENLFDVACEQAIKALASNNPGKLPPNFIIDLNFEGEKAWKYNMKRRNENA